MSDSNELTIQTFDAIHAITSYNAEKLEYLLEKGLDPRAMHTDDLPVAWWAVIYKSTECLALLSDKGADFSTIYGGCTALHHITLPPDNDYPPIGGDVVQTILDTHRQTDCFNIVKNNFLANDHTEQQWLAFLNHRDTSGLTVLDYAIDYDKSGNYVDFLLSEGASPNSLGDDHLSPLARAARGGDIETATLLLSYDADAKAREADNHFCFIDHAMDAGKIDFVKAMKNKHDLSAETCMHDNYDYPAAWVVLQAPRNRQIELLDNYVRLGQIDLTPNNPRAWRFFDELISNDNCRPKIIRYLAEHKISLDWRMPYEPYGTLLHLAAGTGKHEKLKMLLEYGADPLVEDMNNDKPADVVNRNNHSKNRDSIKLIHSFEKKMLDDMVHSVALPQAFLEQIPPSMELEPMDRKTPLDNRARHAQPMDKLTVRHCVRAHLIPSLN